MQQRLDDEVSLRIARGVGEWAALVDDSLANDRMVVWGHALEWTGDQWAPVADSAERP